MGVFVRPSTRTNPIRLFEENYALFMHFLPDLHRRDTFTLAGGEGEGALLIRVGERTPYTTRLSLRQRLGSGEGPLPDLDMTVRLYHDAQAAEVIAYQGCQRIPAPYAAQPPHHRDEKRQVNQLLHQILRYCVRRDRQRIDCTSP